MSSDDQGEAVNSLVEQAATAAHSGDGETFWDLHNKIQGHPPGTPPPAVAAEKWRK